MNAYRTELKLECRWCKRRLPKQWRDVHEQVCSRDTTLRQQQVLTEAAARCEELRTSESYRRRWRALPGKGWGALAGSYELVEVLSVR